MNTIIYFLLALAYVGLLIWGIRLSKYDGLWNLSNVLLLVIVGLIYDNLIIALGKYIGEGSILESLSYPRYWLHALFTPTLILFAWHVCYRVGITWASKLLWKGIAFLLTFGIILYELFTSLIGLTLEPKWENGILTYEAVELQGHMMIMLITIVLLIVGFILLKNFHFSWLLFGTIIMTAGSFLVSLLKSTDIMNILELILIISLLMTRQFEIRNEEVNKQHRIISK